MAFDRSRKTYMLARTYHRLITSIETACVACQSFLHREKERQTTAAPNLGEKMSSMRTTDVMSLVMLETGDEGPSAALEPRVSMWGLGRPEPILLVIFNGHLL
ncbi:hypothetical protein MGYG_06035 [Nannizzia gypsea CBS 118893]|uniref:Uncharacterized protein n=1 Tax=Arthroderma gypseum (strain ATCC MYA-4604 / CBS 118893) TaxID=535722 RepID=E4V098_ARTGP|nr:hypothetical protein MGYG_06035 [Nannizzia gypsea CBS 118893]EFR03035.1 hypothetical protein MGYG_06035 [Nannizzia gypsea CBS 118893]